MQLAMVVDFIWMFKAVIFVTSNAWICQNGFIFEVQPVALWDQIFFGGVAKGNGKEQGSEAHQQKG